MILAPLFMAPSLGCYRLYTTLDDSSEAASETTGTMTSTGELSSSDGTSGCTDDCPDTPICGDGEIVSPESCDDHNLLSGDGCEADCTITPGWPCGDHECVSPEDAASCPKDCDPVCGDQSCSAGEDANNCAQDCTAECGQGSCEPGETPELCPKDCAPGTCPNHACDGAEDPTTCLVDCPVDSCGNHVCEPARMEHDPASPNFCDADCDPDCGDGVVWGDTEACDDGNEVDEDECSNSCTPARFVFITTEPSTGALGGIAGADALCDAAAGDLAGTFKAWLSDDDPNNAPAVRFASADFKGWYLLPGDPNKGTSPAPVAHGWSGLNSTLVTPITRHANGVELNAALASVWTNTSTTGELVDPVKMKNCEAWFSGSAGSSGVIGVADERTLGVEWTNINTNSCNSLLRLYCFQVSP